MARILLADDGIVFDGTSLEAGPLGGVESSVVNLMTELAKRGHEVHVRNNCPNQLNYKGVLEFLMEQYIHSQLHHSNNFLH